jgi:D-threonate/D-erythronate kinase
VTSLRLLADDLTGALDTAAEFAGLVGPVPVFWNGAIPDELPANAALDSTTRELDPEQAGAIVAEMTPHLADATIAFKKVDSLMRGATIVELASCLRAGGWDHCVLAPAFPYQGRITRGGRQYASAPGGNWIQVGGDLIAELRALGLAAQAGRLDAVLPPGVSVFEAETHDDLRRVVATAQRCGDKVLWSGTGGLAQAIAADSHRAVSATLPLPILGLFGSDQAATAGQLAACARHWTELQDGGPAGADILARGMSTAGIALASFIHPDGTSRPAASGRIAREMQRLIQQLDPPGSLVVAGGETLRSLCLSLGATSLEVQGRMVPGVPRSVMRGGRWDGVTVVSKSGAFGHPTLLRDLLPIPETNTLADGNAPANGIVRRAS